MPAYDESYSPAAPIAQAALRSAETGKMVSNIPMLIDTGADLTLVPRIAVDQLGISAIPDEQYELIGFDGNRSLASVGDWNSATRRTISSRVDALRASSIRLRSISASIARLPLVTTQL